MVGKPLGTGRYFLLLGAAPLTQWALCLLIVRSCRKSNWEGMGGQRGLALTTPLLTHSWVALQVERQKIPQAWPLTPPSRLHQKIPADRCLNLR